MIKLKQAFEDFHDRIMKQIAEKIWEITRVEKLEGKEFYQFVGEGVIKEKLIKKLKDELRERQENLKVLNEIIKKHAK